METSFAGGVKEELCRAALSRACCAVAECYGILLYCNTFSAREIKIVTESRAFAQRLPKLFRRALDVSFDVVPEQAEGAGKLIFAITDPASIQRIFGCFGGDPQGSVSLHINLGVIEEDCCRSAFVRGIFLAGGSVTDPAKGYHLELATSHYSVSREAYSLLLDMGFTPKETQRKANYLVYFKQSDELEDFLTKCGAPVSAMEVMQAKMEKDLRNSVNRQVNCDTANLSKAVEAAQEQLAAIRLIEKRDGLGSLPDKLRQTAQMRIDNPEATLAELAELMTPPITKSCLNHRLRKLMELAAEK